MGMGMGLGLGGPMSGYYSGNNMAASLLAQSKFNLHGRFRVVKLIAYRQADISIDLETTIHSIYLLISFNFGYEQFLDLASYLHVAS